MMMSWKIEEYIGKENQTPLKQLLKSSMYLHNLFPHLNCASA